MAARGSTKTRRNARSPSKQPAPVDLKVNPTGPRLVDTIVLKDVDKLLPYANNARTHSKKQITQIAASIKEFGFVNPVLIQPDGGIIAGHGRVMAAQKLGLDHVPTIELGHLSEAQRKALVLADNRIALSAGWDEELLSVELVGIRDLGMDVEVMGFSDRELRRLVEGGGDPDGADRKVGDELDYQIVIECGGEADQAALLERLRGEGLKCRPLIL